MSAVYRDLEQRSPEWFAARLGIPTASRFDSIITPVNGDLSKQSDGYLRELLAEWLSGQSAESYSSGWMARGQEVEQEARDFYAFERGLAVAQVGFVYADGSRSLGCSPDGLIDGDGMIEIKCPKPSTQIGYLLAGGLPPDYRPQVFGSLLITGRRWCDFLAYCPGLPPILVRVERDEIYIAKMRSALDQFIARLVAGKQELINKGYKPEQSNAN